MKSGVAVPVIMIAVGIGWLLSVLGIAPAIDWVWTLALLASGLLVFILGGFDKVTFVAGIGLILCSLLSVLRQTGRLPLNVEMPLLVIAVGALLLVARHPKIPAPKWLSDSALRP